MPRAPPWGSPAVLISAKLRLVLVRLRERTVSTLCHSEMRSGGRTALVGGLALFALSVFLAGATVGAWAGVVRIWPVRYSLHHPRGTAEAICQNGRVAACRGRTPPGAS